MVDVVACGPPPLWVGLPLGVVALVVVSLAVRQLWQIERWQKGRHGRGVKILLNGGGSKMTLGEKILATEPTLIGAADGSWLAVAGEGAIVRVGVMGQTQEAARVRFKEALTRFAAAVEGAGGKST